MVKELREILLVAEGPPVFLAFLLPWFIVSPAQCLILESALERILEQDSPKRAKIVQKVAKITSIFPKLLRLRKIAQNCPKNFKIAPKLPKMMRKYSKIAQLPRIAKITQNL